jgi:hypothetical protein
MFIRNQISAILFVCAASSVGFAQRVPALSPSATVQQTVGVTDFTVNYSRPSLKGRQAFGNGSPLAPLGEIWRTGANQATTLEASTAFSFGGKAIPAGKYALFSIPANGSWTLILNKNFQGGIGAYAESNDVARVTVSPTAGPATETFSIGFGDLTETTANLTLAWAGVSVPVKLEVDTESLTEASIREGIAKNGENPAALQTAGNYLLGKGKNLDQALSFADKAIGLKETFGNVWLKAQILNKLGKVSEAIPLAQRALSLGEASGEASFASFYKGQIESGLADWKAKLPAETPMIKKGKKK